MVKNERELNSLLELVQRYYRIFLALILPVILGLQIALFLVPQAFFAGILLLVALALLSSSARALRRARAFLDVPTSRIRSASQGYAELKGVARVEAGTDRVAPLTGTQCHYWQLIARRSRRGRQDGAVRVQARSDPFFLPIEDGTGTCYVMISAAELHGHHTVRDFDSLAQIGSLTDHFGPADAARLRAPGPWTIEEICFPADRPLYVTGQFQSLRSRESPFEVDWLGRNVTGLAGFGARFLRPVVASANRAWFAEMRRVEGIAEDAPLQGAERVHILTEGMEHNMIVKPILSMQHEDVMARRAQRRAAWLAALGVVALAAGTVLGHFFLAPEQAGAFYRGLIG